ncbi:hypothetical protein CROQUDRAFT_667949 [Cronartium quercuum f. sp. fusiforme G11]|uniref:Uncharacterized protein n=1 Tax=Cronartium quercuum f. sp. fusiforme G11 TaxID=708437 RepID=A0A9P6NXL0_9BASI|nr:hypothetical protein CROQUDRAFT_667949 [Cronartium quercuum f. sp. fusiforme G11]
MLSLFQYVFSLSFILLTFSTTKTTSAGLKTCNVLEFGAVADNQTDIGPALIRAFGCAQKSITNRAADTVILIPDGNYKLASKVVFDKSKFFTLTVNGYLYMPYDPTLQGNMVAFTHCNDIIVNGHGRLYGNGDRYRPAGNLHMNPQRPRLVRFDTCDRVDYSGVSLYDAPMYHLVIWLGNNIHIHNFEIHSANIGATDGINVAGKNICVTAKSPITGLKVENIVCQAGTGCGVGSMGASQKGYKVENVNYRNVTLTDAANGVILKSYSGASGVITNLTYSDFKLTDVAYPIKLDYNWGGTLKPQWTKRQKRAEAIQTWSEITFDNFKGTGTKYRPPVTVICPLHTPCRDLNFENIQITGTTKTALISNACGKVDAISRKTIPNLPEC